MTQPPPHADLTSLTLAGWRQFGSVDLRFHPTLTVLTGANASGKTTLLGILGQHFNWATQLLGIPIRDRSSGATVWRSDVRESGPGARQIGQLIYRLVDQEIAAPLLVQADAQQYQVGIQGQQFVPGVYISSHRSLSMYQPLATLPLQFSPSSLLLDQFMGEIRTRWAGGSSGRTPLSFMKEALIAAAIYGEGNSSVEPNPEAQQVWDGFQAVLVRVLPQSLQFRKLTVRLPDLLIETGSSEFLLESMSGGVNAIIELSWQIFLRSRDYESFTVCIDEPENHLHPSLQRSLLPGLIGAFPHIRFVVATHSPFIVTAVPESNVYVLEEVDPGAGVASRLLETANKSATSDETLRRVLGMETTAPEWVEQRLLEVLQTFPLSGVGPGDVTRLRDELTAIGLREEFPNAVDSLLGEAGHATAPEGR